MIYSYMFVGSNRMKCSLGGNDGGEKKRFIQAVSNHFQIPNTVFHTTTIKNNRPIHNIFK